MAAHRNHALLERRRRKACGMFDRNVPVSEVARTLGVATQVVYRWKQAWQRGGEQALASKGPAGPKSRLTQGQLDELVAALLKGPVAQGYKTQLWTLPRVACLIKDLTGVEYHPGHVWRILGSLGFSCQRPERRAIERDDQAIGQWKRVHWPAIKKKRPSKAAKSSSSTKAG
ncbi:transposase [bacterium]|nr:transposase [bacterium]